MKNKSRFYYEIRNCDVSKGKYGKLEVIIKTFTKVEECDATFNISDPETDGTTPIDLQDLPQQDNYERVTLYATILKLFEPKQVGSDNVAGPHGQKQH